VHLVQIFTGVHGQVIETAGQEAIVIQASDDQFRESLLFGGEVGERQLIHQVLLKRQRWVMESMTNWWRAASSRLTGVWFWVK
jgi:hypothetical protein